MAINNIYLSLYDIIRIEYVRIRCCYNNARRKK